METIIEKTHKKARKLHSCQMFTGKESFGELMSLFLSPQGIEFCQKNNFPDMALMREFKAQGAGLYGIYIDAGDIRLSDTETVCLAGNTNAELSFDDPMGKHVVVLMHGAKANITASGYSVVFVYATKDCTINKTIKDFAKIL